MSALREVADRIARMGSFPTPNADRRLDCERMLATLGGCERGERRETEDWDDFLRRIGLIDG